MLDYSSGPIELTRDYRKTASARAVPYAEFRGGAWWLPPDPDPESARWAIRLFPELGGRHPELLAKAHMSAVDHSPIDLATAHWERVGGPQRAVECDGFPRVLAEMRADDKEPHGFQRIDVEYAAHCLDSGRGAYLGHEMGLGKTLASLMLIEKWPANFILIACPNNAKQDPWAQSLARFCPWLEVVVVGNDAASRDAAMKRAQSLMKAGTPCAVVCHYAAFKLIAGKSKRGWDKLGQFDLKIADEAHLFKKKTAQFVSAFRRIKSAGTLMLSGSVMSGPSEDLFVPFQMLRPKRYTDRWAHWIDPYHEVIDGDYGKIIVGPKLPALGDFKNELGQCLVVRRAKDYIELPEARDLSVAATFHPAQRKAYHALADELLAELPDGQIKTVTEGAALLTALRRVTGGVPGPGGTYISGKADDCLAFCEAAADSQHVIFAWHKELLRGIAAKLIAAGIPTGIIDGDVAQAKRPAIVDLFKRQGYRVLVASISTMSASVNLQNASFVTMAEEDYDPTNNEQAVARVLRQGQVQHVTVRRLRVVDSVDDLRVLPVYTTKQELRRLVLGS